MYKTTLIAIVLVCTFALGLLYKPKPVDKSKYKNTTDWIGWKNKHEGKPWE